MRREEVGTAVTEQQLLPYFFKLLLIMTLKYIDESLSFSLSHIAFIADHITIHMYPKPLC